MPRSRARSKNKQVPDRWMDYIPMNKAIPELNIVAFKVPLPIRLFEDDDYMMRHKWTPSDVMLSLPELGLVIDLTFKFPAYYSPTEFLENGIDWIKIGCPGHVIPPDDIFTKFCDTIDAFHREHPNLLVGVHCTHGVNRTGYMICRYMVERHGFTPVKALQTFADARGHEVERDNYKQKIRSSKLTC